MGRKLILRCAHRWFIPLMVLATLLLILIPTSVVKADPPPGHVVTFPDPNLQAAIRAAIGKPSGDILQSDLDGLTSLFASSLGIANLTGLEHCTSLTRLNLESNQISDISPLSGLTSLTYLYLGDDPQISVISPLAGLTSLTTLSLVGNYRISDVSPLAGLTSLTTLGLARCQISNLSPLAGLTNLTWLYLDGTQISNLSPLAGLTNLTWLSLNSNQISNISSLSGLTNLTWLYLKFNQISDIQPLVNNPGLSSGDEVDIQANPLSPTSVNTYIPQLQARGVTVAYTDPVITFPDPNLQAAIRAAIGKPSGDIYQSDLAGLTTLRGAGRDIADLTGLEHCTSLTRLDLYNNQISNLSPLSGLTSLTRLDLSANQISNLSPLAGLTNLTLLYCGNNQISNLSPLAGLTSLMDLDVSGNQISNLSPLAGLTSLMHLFLTSNQISNLSPLAGLTNLTELWLYSNQISDISPLSVLTSLTSLRLSSNQISDVSPLSGLTSLTRLELYNNQISNIQALVNNPGLSSGDSLYIQENPLSSTSLNVYIPQLQGRGVVVYWDTDDVVTFPDPILQAAIRAAIGKPSGDILQSDLDGLTSLSDSGGMANLTGLEHCTNLTLLWLMGNQISDLSPLSGLTNLTMLNLSRNHISNISPLAGLTNLTSLDLTANQITDISLLAGLTNLSYLTLDGNRISNLEPLVHNPGLGPGGSDVIQVLLNPLSSASTTTWIPILEGRGVLVFWHSVATATGTGMVTLQFDEWSPPGTRHLNAVSEASLPSQGKPSVQFPHGFFEFEIPVPTAGQSGTLTITLPSAVPTTAQYWKYGPTPSNHTPHWYQIAMGDNDGDNVITITLTDGGLGDDDLTANGVIVDQGGPGWPGPSGGGGGGHSAPVFPSVYVGIGAALGAGILAYALRKRLAAR